MKFASLKYRISANLGDQIQTIAAEQFLPRVDLRVNRDTLAQANLNETHVLIMNGWFSHGTSSCFPPAENILPIFFGFHITDWHEGRILRYFLNEKCINYLKKNGPVGCRDRKTMERLQERGVDAFYSKCLTLTLPKREVTPNNGKVFFVGINDKASIPDVFKEPPIYVTHGVKDYYPDSIKHQMALHLLKMYKEQARLIVTSKIHCAMPCIAMGIPVVFFGNENDYRISILKDLGLPIYSSMVRKEIVNSIDWDPAPIDIESEKEQISKSLKALIDQRVDGDYSEQEVSSENFQIKSKDNVYSKQSIGKLIRNIKHKKLTYLSSTRLGSLANICLELESNRIDGCFIEAGCALGGSAILLTALKSNKRNFQVYDVFSTIPPPSGEDGEDVLKRYEVIQSGQSNGINGDPYYGYIDNLKDKVTNTFTDFGLSIIDNNVKLIEGLLENTLRVDSPVCLAHIDVDWHDPVLVCLNRIEPNLVVGGYLIVDDYNDWSGCRKAVDHYFADKRPNFVFDSSQKHLIIKKVA